MNKLLSAEFVRLFQSFVFKLGMVFSVGLSAFVILMRWTDVKVNPDSYAKLSVEYSNADGLIFLGGLYLIFAIAILIGIFVGTEYSDGTIRNKLTVGHTRRDIYFSKLIVCAFADLVIHLLYILTTLILGSLLIHGTTMSAKRLLLFTLVSITAVSALTALLLLLSMSIQSKAAGSIVSLLAVLILFFSTMSINQRLDAPKYYDAYTYVDRHTGEVIEVEKEKNPNYLRGTKRRIYEFLNNFLPSSQLFQIALNNSDHLALIAVYDSILILLTTGAGIVIFQKKNLK